VSKISGFDEVHSKIDGMDGRFIEFRKEINERFDKVDGRFDEVNDRLDRVEFGANSQERRITNLEDKVQLISKKVGLSK
jgi:predicted nuclease with TOPRIM domain